MKTKLQIRVKKSLPAILAFMVLSLSAIAASPEEGFRMLKQRNGINLYYRWIQMPEGNKVREMKAVLEIDGGTTEVIDLLKDEQRGTNWIASAEQFRNLTDASGNNWISYIQFSTPWPLADQDCVLEYSIEQDPAGQSVVRFTRIPEYIPAVDGVTRMKDISGSIVIRTLSEGKSILELYFLSKKASALPKWLVEPIITGNMFNLLEGLRNELTAVQTCQTLVKP